MQFLRAGKFLVTRITRLAVRLSLTVAGAGLLVFILLETSISGGYRAVLLPNGDTGTDRARAVTEAFYLDHNVIVRWFYWMGDLLQGDLGVSSTRRAEAVTGIITHRLPISVQIMVMAIVLTVFIGVPLGLISVLRSGTWLGRTIDVIVGLSQSIPVYVTPLFLVGFFAVRLQWLPASGWTRISESLGGNLKQLILPMTALVFSQIGDVARVVRTDVTRAMNSDFITAAIGKGLTPGYILFRHALRPASIGLINVLALNVGALLTGAVIIELVFGFGGLGMVLFEASINRDLYALLGVTTYAAIVHVVLHTIFDELLGWLDPQIDVGGSGTKL